MKIILATAYAVNPYKGSEEGTGWNFMNQISRYNKVIAVTRKNNRQDIERYMKDNESSNPQFSNIQFMYFDLPKWMIWWKKGPLLSALYFYMWQFFVAVWLKTKRISFDIVHSVNFHSNWTPSFLWILGKPMVWGPVGNHPLIPKQYILDVYGRKAFLKDRMLWMIKLISWNLDPFHFICRKKAVKVLCVNSQAVEKLKLPKSKAVMMPAVASENPGLASNEIKEHGFTVFSAARFVPLKGFDLAIRAYANFYRSLPPCEKINTTFIIIGSGPEKKLIEKLVAEADMQDAIQVKKWMPRDEVIETFKKSSVFLFPSHEGAGMVVAEALSYGVPVVCLDNFGPGEYVHAQSDLKVKHGNYNDTVSELAEKLKTLFYNQSFYNKEKHLAIDQYRSQFQWNIKGQQLNEIYEEILLKEKKNPIIVSTHP